VNDEALGIWFELLPQLPFETDTQLPTASFKPFFTALMEVSFPEPYAVGGYQCTPPEFELFSGIIRAWNNQFRPEIIPQLSFLRWPIDDVQGIAYGGGLSILLGYYKKFNHRDQVQRLLNGLDQYYACNPNLAVLSLSEAVRILVETHHMREAILLTELLTKWLENDTYRFKHMDDANYTNLQKACIHLIHRHTPIQRKQWKDFIKQAQSLIDRLERLGIKTGTKVEMVEGIPLQWLLSPLQEP
jgi:hypothetical protein